MTKLDGRIMGRKVQASARHSAARNTVANAAEKLATIEFNQRARFWLCMSLLGVGYAAAIAALFI